MNRWKALVGLALAGAAVPGCGAPPTASEMNCRLSPNALVISEFLSRPAESQPEWIELQNRGEQPASLAGVSLEISGSGAARRYALGATSTVGVDGFWVVSEAEGAELDFVDEVQPFQLSNSGGILELWCGGSLLDAVAYGERGTLKAPEEYRSLARDSLADEWCDSGVDGGTPGRANPRCGVLDCPSDGGRLSAEGDLVITEVFANPDGADAGAEWIELFNRSESPVYAYGLSLISESVGGRRRVASVDDEPCRVIEPNGFSVLAASSNPNFASTFRVPELNLYNSASLVILRRGEVSVDQASVPESLSGRSAYIEGAEPTSNDSPDRFCLSDGAGTPGEPNPPCFDLSERCVESGTTRVIRGPRPGAIALSEVFFDPEGADGNQEFIELFAFEDFDLNGVRVQARSASSGNTRSAVANDRDCLSVSEGEYVVLAVEPRDGRRAALRGPSSLFYNDAGQTVSLLDGSDEILDFAVLPDAPEGHSVHVRELPPDPSNNDAASAWCVEARLGGSGGEAGACR